MPIERLYREDLERQLAHMRLALDQPTADGLELAPSCHPGAHVDVAYWEGALHLRCADCQRLVVAVVVEPWASPPPESDA
jgi:hypothetical protein